MLASTSYKNRLSVVSSSFFRNTVLTVLSVSVHFLYLQTLVKKVKICFYIAQYPVRWTAQSSLHFSSPGIPVLSDINSASLGSILAMQQLLRGCSVIVAKLPTLLYLELVICRFYVRFWRIYLAAILYTVLRSIGIAYVRNNSIATLIVIRNTIIYPLQTPWGINNSVTH